MLLGNRMVRTGYVAQFIINCPFVWNLLNTSFRFGCFSQYVAHVAIAINRYRVMADPLASEVR